MKFFIIFNLKTSVTIQNIKPKGYRSKKLLNFFCDKKKRNRNGKIHSYHEVKGIDRLAVLMFFMKLNALSLDELLQGIERSNCIQIARFGYIFLNSFPH